MKRRETGEEIKVEVIERPREVQEQYIQGNRGYKKNKKKGIAMEVSEKEIAGERDKK